MNEPTSSTKKASTKFKMLKKVKVFSRIICFSVLVLMPSSALLRPISMRFRTASAERPVFRSVQGRAFSVFSVSIPDFPFPK